VAFDPPYVHNPGTMIINDSYQNAETTKGLYHNDITKLYQDGMKEAYRILKPNGIMLVKCKDEVESSVQRWSHIEFLLVASKMGMYAKDLFVVTQKNLPAIQHKKQVHARKNHSYLWVFVKMEEKDKRIVVQREMIKRLA
jgi:ubiquinone/menaquinone biosynthesis C-methylase UbiE